MKTALYHHPEFLQSAPTQTTSAKPKKPKDPQPDYCLTCRIPVGKCKGNCTKQQQKLNGGN